MGQEQGNSQTPIAPPIKPPEPPAATRPPSPPTKDDYTVLYDSAKLDQGAQLEIAKVATMCLEFKSSYIQVENLLLIPWYLVAGIHYREASFNFNSYLGNGQPLNAITTMVPKGRGPFKDWMAGAEDALKLQHADNIKSWPLSQCLSFAEHYNGMGYHNRGINSPYLWAGTNQYKLGMYVSDGHFDPNKQDKRPGVAALMIYMQAQGWIMQPATNAYDQPLAARI